MSPSLPRPSSRPRPRRGLRVLTALALPTASLGLVALTAPAASAANPAEDCVLNGSAFDCAFTYGFTGAEQVFTVPDGVASVSVVAVGAAGGAYDGASPGRGAVVTTALTVAPGSTYYVLVGGTGNSSGSTPGSFNGGGASTAGANSGGGATDLRTTSSAAGASSLDSRVVVAGGGGGADLSGAHGGDAGLVGSSGSAGDGSTGTPGAGATQTAGGAAGTGGSPVATAGQLGLGGDGGSAFGGGGGGGLYGGGGGGGSTNSVGNGGGGGSSLVPSGGTVEVNSTGQAPQMRIAYTSPVTAASGLVLTDELAAGTDNPVQITVTDGEATATTAADSLSVAPNGGDTGATCTASGCTATKVGTYTVTGTYGEFSASRSFTVVPGPAATTELSPATGTIAAGEGQQYAVTGEDAYGNDLGDLTATSTVTATLDGDATPCSGGLCAPTVAGSYVVTSSTPGATAPVLDTAALTVEPGPLARLAISPQDATSRAGEGVGYSVAGFDAYDNARPGQDAAITLGSPEGQVACPDGICTPTKAGDRLVTASAPGAQGVPVTTSTGLAVLASDAATLTLSPADATAAAGEPTTYTVGGEDEYGNALPDQTSASTITYAPADGLAAPVTCTDASCAPTVAGLYTVIAAQQGPDAPAPASGTLRIVAAEVASISLSPAETTTQAGVQVPYTVTGSDRFGNVVGDVTSDSGVTVSGPSGNDVACAQGVCVLETAGDHVVTAATPVAGDVPVTSNAVLHVAPAALASVELSPGTSTVTAGDPVVYTVTGSDTYGNSLGDVTQDATVEYARAGEASTPCPDASCVATSAGTYVVTATVGSTVDTATLVVQAHQAAVEVARVVGVVYGEEVPVSATVTSPDGVPTGAVQFALDGEPLGAPVELDESGRATRPAQPGVHAGLHTLTAEFVSAGEAFTSSTDDHGFVVAKAPTTTAVVVRAGSVDATVTGVGEPTGSVRFAIDGRAVGDAVLTDGVATYTGSTATDRDSVVTAAYTGDADHEGSSASTVRQDPVLDARIGGTPRSGWHNGPVTVTFECRPGSGAVQCPAPVVLATEGAGQYVTRTVTAADGGVATVTAGPVNIDLTAPVAVVDRVVDGRDYKGGVRQAACAGSDALSGLVSCSVATTGGPFGSITSTATATDVAGNVTTASATYRVQDAWLNKSSYDGTAWTVARGKRRVVHVMAEGRPTMSAPRSVDGSQFRLAGQRTDISHWVAAVTVDRSVKPGSVLKLGVGTGREKRVVKVRVTR